MGPPEVEMSAGEDADFVGSKVHAIIGTLFRNSRNSNTVTSYFYKHHMNT